MMGSGTHKILFLQNGALKAGEHGVGLESGNE